MHAVKDLQGAGVLDNFCTSTRSSEIEEGNNNKSSSTVDKVCWRLARPRDNSQTQQGSTRGPSRWVVDVSAAGGNSQGA